MLVPILLFLLLLQGKPAQDPPKKKPEVAPKMVLVEPGEQKADPDDEGPLEHDLNPERAKKEMKVGNFYLRKGKYTAAVARFREALKWHPRLAAAYFKLGRAYEKRGELRNALGAIRSIWNWNPRGRKPRRFVKLLPAWSAN